MTDNYHIVFYLISTRLQRKKIKPYRLTLANVRFLYINHFDFSIQLTVNL